MQVEIRVPDTIQFCVRMDIDDELHHQCMWARVTFDNKNWSMMAQSDAGDYSYSWCVESGGRSFLELMQQIDSDYLLCKISDRTVFDLEETKKAVIEWVYEEEQAERMIEEINAISACNEREFISDLEDIDGMEEYSDLWECIHTDYPNGAKVFARIFTEVIQPEISKYLKSSTGRGSICVNMSGKR